MKKLSFIVSSILLLLTSCNSSLNNIYPIVEDIEEFWYSVYEEGDTITFVNELNEELSLYVETNFTRMSNIIGGVREPNLQGSMCIIRLPQTYPAIYYGLTYYVDESGMGNISFWVDDAVPCIRFDSWDFSVDELSIKGESGPWCVVKRGEGITSMNLDDGHIWTPLKK